MDNVGRVKLPFGRGSSRGRGRFLTEFTEVVVPIGRGRCMKQTDVCQRSSKLMVKLSTYIRTGSGSILEITMEYFEHHNDYPFYVEKVLDAALQSPAIITDFTMNIKLITLMKIHGEEIKIALFSKLQETFEKHSSFMKDPEPEDVNPKKKKLMENLCDLLSQLYYRFRVNLDNQQRYTVFEFPVIESMNYLLKAKGMNSLFILFKMVTHNSLALSKNHSEELIKISVKVRSLLVTQDPSADKMYLSWLMCILECINQGGFEFPVEVKKFYVNTCGPQLLVLAPCPQRRILSDVPDNIVNGQMDNFDCSFESYSQYVFLSKESC